MDRMNRIFALHQVLASCRYPVSRERLMQELECSRATLTRILAEMRDLLAAPIEYDAVRGGYRYSHEAYELPGLWFTPSELYALVAAQKLLHEAQPGLLERQLAPLKGRIEKLLGSGRDQGELARRVHVLRQAARTPDACRFQTLADATARRVRVHIRYHGRGRGDETSRDLSPQRLIHYRDNWYLDAWCHLREEIRSFSLDRIAAAQALDLAALEIPEERLDAHFKRSYGIFSGAPVATAVLRFCAERARWVADELWHPEQRGQWLEDGRYELAVPYADPRELVMDILKYGPDVEVMAPEELRRAVVERLREALAVYA
ncbi:MAG: YafY family transcriptional regulator [Betaproteobacteria bacterium]|nr:YafY family transcriptional regulator [Betaproteobacteria bacterium]